MAKRTSAKRIFLLAVVVLLLSSAAACSTQEKQSASSRTTKQPAASQGSTTGKGSTSPLGHHCLRGSTIKTKTSAAPRFEVLKNCYFADSGGIRSQNITVRTEATSAKGLYRIAKNIRDSGGVWVDTTVVSFVRGSGDHQEKIGRAFLTSRQFGGKITVSLENHSAG